MGMRKRMVVAAAVAAAVSLGAVPGGTAGATPDVTRPVVIRASAVPRPKPVPAVSARIVAHALKAPGRAVRETATVRVDRVRVPAGLQGRASAPDSVLRVRVRGSFPPRALRYVVLAGATPIGYGIPAPDLGSVVAITADDAVLSERITVRYGSSLGPSAGTPSRGPRASSAHRPAPAAVPGPFEVRRAEYDFGNQVYQPPGLTAKVEMRAVVHHPKKLQKGPFPLILFLHGNHVTCFREHRIDFRWPCREGWTPIPNYEGYDYIARRLASYGYIVVSISGNGVNVHGSNLQDTGMAQRGHLLQRHVSLWQRWNAAGAPPFGDEFVGAVDMSRIGTMGHSRGGEGAIWQVIVDRQRANPYGIDAVLPLAPVDFTRETVNDIPMAVILPYCDGDVFDLQGIHFFDDARYRLPGDPTPKHTVTVYGANHNFFNTVWTPGNGVPGGFDDTVPGCEDRLGPAGQREVGAAYIISFFRRYVGETLRLDPIWTGERPPKGIPPKQTLVSYHAPDLPDRRRDIDRFTKPADLSRNHLGGDVVATDMGLWGWCADTFSLPCVPQGRGFFSPDVHLPGLAQAIIGWQSDSSTAVVRFEIPPADGDVSVFEAVQFRTAINIGYQVSQFAQFQNLVLALEDGSGARQGVAASEVGNEALAAPTGRRFGQHVILNQVRFPLSRYDQVDLTDIRAVELRFNRTPEGVIDVVDLNFSSGAN